MNAVVKVEAAAVGYATELVEAAYRDVAPSRCSRAACGVVIEPGVAGIHKDTDLPYCPGCTRRINEANGQELVVRERRRPPTVDRIEGAAAPPPPPLLVGVALTDPRVWPERTHVIEWTIPAGDTQWQIRLGSEGASEGQVRVMRWEPAARHREAGWYRMSQVDLEADDYRMPCYLVPLEEASLYPSTRIAQAAIVAEADEA
jgi:hypothetical protein